MKFLRYSFVFLTVVLILGLIGCGGGSESATGDGSLPSSDSNGTVALMLTDGPADEYDRIIISLERILLLTADGDSQVVVFEPDAPAVYDLLELRPEGDDDGGALLAVKDVPAGFYSKIRLVVTSVRGEKDLENNQTAVTEFKLSSGKIDLNPRGQFEVAPNTTLNITLDIDCDKSIHLSGNKKVFRPVVFVDIAQADNVQRCPRIMEGAIAALTYAEDETTVTGFDLMLDDNGELVPIQMDEFTAIIDDEGQVTDAQSLNVGDAVYVRGTLGDGGVLASLVVVGDLTRYEGTVTTPVADDIFAIFGDAEQTVAITTGTLILQGCDTLLSPDAIQPGMQARIIGKWVDDHIVAVAVILSPQVMSGEITAMEAVEGGYTVTLALPESQGNVLTSIFLPSDTPINAKFDGTLTADELADLVLCQKRQATIAIDLPAGQALTATKAVVLPESGDALVQAVDPDARLLTVEMNSETALIDVKQDAHIFDFTSADQPAAALSDIEPGDQLLLYGFSKCPGAESDPDFTAVVILVNPDLPDSQL